MKNRKFQLFLLVPLLSLGSFAKGSNLQHLTKKDPTVKSKQIIFIENQFSTALKKAKAESKYIFVDAYTTWCGPCKQLKQTTFKDSRAAEFFNKNFVNAAIDMEKRESTKLALEWNIQQYPTLMILDEHGKVILGSIGYLNAEQLIDFGKRALKKH